MKKIFYSLVVFIAFSAKSQITITSADMPNVGDTIRLSIINGTILYDLNNTGTNYTWDFSFLQPQLQRVDTFVNTFATNPAYYFNFNNCFFDPDHCASYAVPIQPPPSFQIPNQLNFNFQLEDVYYYFKESTSKYTQVGFGAKLNGIPISQKYDPVDLVYEFPLNFSNSFSSTSSFAFDFPNSDDYFGRTTNRINTVDGWGTLVTPFGSFQTLRVESELNITDTFYSDTANFGMKIPRKEYEYKWLANGKKIPVLQINASEGVFGQKIINQIIYRDSVRMDINTSLKNIFTTNYDAIIFPNPNDGKFMVRITNHYGFAKDADTYKLQITNLLGEKVYSSTLTSTLTSTSISTNLPKGIYFVEIISENGTQVKKMVVN